MNQTQSTSNDMNKTDIKNVENNKCNESTTLCEYKNEDEDDIRAELRKKAIDLFSPLEKRIESLIEYYNFDPETISEVVSNIIGLNFFSRTKAVQEYLIAICYVKEIPLSYRIECAKNLASDALIFSSDIKDTYLGYKQVYDIFEMEKESIKNLPTPLRVDTVLFLIQCDKYKNESREYFCEIIEDKSLDDLFRIKIIQSLENQIKENDKFVFFAKEATLHFIRNEKNTFTYRTIAGQYLFEKCKPTPEEFSNTENFLLNVAKQQDLDENIRADACDILLQYASESIRELAMIVLYEIGGGFEVENNMFKNRQNVHIRSIENSVQILLDKISEYVPNNGKRWNFEESKKDLLTKFKNSRTENMNITDLEHSLIRVTVDRAVYGTVHMTLSTIFAKIWTYIQDSQDREEMEKRMVEELIDANNMCSTGFASRMINSLSGFGDMNITISFEDQITANLEAQLNKKIMNIEDDNLSGLILEEMTLPNRFYEKRKNFLKFFRSVISSIRESMHKEFSEHITDTDFDLYFRKALYHYDGMDN